MPNRLAAESSPYLLQHQNNPVDWYPWGPAALERARREHKPIFLSVGYSACHWCHVMEHESFEDEQIAALLNEHFVCIKVDREERPDIDQIYMDAVQLMTGRGGWPMSVFLTPDLHPFYGGTYWPPRSRGQMPGFDRVLLAVADAWHNRREMAIEQAAELTAHLQETQAKPHSGAGLRLELLDAAGVVLVRIFDARHGGFGGAPKFPHPMDLQVLLRLWHRHRRADLLNIVRVTLQKMADGGIYDHLAGGFARYSVDAQWLVPHFEKMLYDNALLASTYCEAYQATGDEQFARIARETLDYLLRDMRDPAGGFHSTEDADSEGVEGKFYVWTPAEIDAVLGTEQGERFRAVYDVTTSGNFEHGQSILHLPRPIADWAATFQQSVESLEAELAESRQALLARRSQRVRPGKDDKVLVSWNALAIEALARAASLFDRDRRYLRAAQQAAHFLLTQLRRPDGRLLHCWRHGHPRFAAYLDDYSYLANALVTLYEADFDERWLVEAQTLAEILLRHFHDAQGGGFFFTADDHEQLIARRKESVDSSVPSGNAMAALALLRLGRYLHDQRYLDAALGTMTSCLGLLEKSSTASGQMLLATDFWFSPTPEWILVGDPNADETHEAVQLLRRTFQPNRLLAFRTNGTDATPSPRPLDALFAGKTASTQLTLYRCQNFQCDAPIVGITAIRQAFIDNSTTINEASR